MTKYTGLQPVEQSVIAYLKAATGKTVRKRVPSTRPSEFVIVRRTGGGPRNLVQSSPTLYIEVWGSGTTETVTVDPWPLTKKVWDAMLVSDEVEMPHGLQVMRVTLTEPVDYPDEATGTPRYTFMYAPIINL